MMPTSTMTVTTTKDMFTGQSTGVPLLVVQLTPHYRKVLREFLANPAKRAHVELYGAAGALAHISDGTPAIGGAVITVDEACCVMEASDDEVVNSYSMGERNLFKWLFITIADSGITEL